ncbi:MAG: phage tail sheath family protein [Lachnospiraceae bacterium]|nr:phage tail sheath family protein [Lachnospiraceae bacterium]
MAEYLSPGVYVEEYDNSPRSIEGVGTSTAGFVGFAEKGRSSGAPVLVTNFRSFTRQFGGFLPEYTYGEYRFLAHSVEQFFANGGTRCYVMRVVAPGAACAQKKSGILTAKAANEGKWGNRIQLSFNTVNKRKMQLIAKSGEATYVAKSVDGFREGDMVCFDGEYNRISVIYDETVTFEEEFKGDVVDESVIPKKVVTLAAFDMQVRHNDEVENYQGLTLNPTSPNYLSAKAAGSNIVKLTLAQEVEIGNPVAAILGDDQESGMLTLEGGSDGNIGKVNAGTFIGSDEGPERRTGIQSFVENDLVSMMAVPGITIPEVVAALVGHCENMRSRFAVIDMPEEMYKTEELIAYRGMIDSTYAAMYHPWIQVFDRGANKVGFVPPSGAVLGVYSRTDINRGVHKAPANEVVFCSGLKVNYSKEEQDILNPEGVNLIRSLPGQGIRVWGARTASSNSAFKYVNVRRLFIFVEESIKANTNWVVFEPNDMRLWQRVSMTISAFLDSMWRTGMLAGSTPQEAYFVEIGAQTMTREDIMNGRLICNVGIAPSRPAEFVIFRVTQHTAEAANATTEEAGSEG